MYFSYRSPTHLNTVITPRFGYIPSTKKELDRLFKNLETRQGFYAYNDIPNRPRSGVGKGRLSLLFHASIQLDPGAYTEAQTTGDCVSHGTRNAIDASRACDIVYRKLPHQWIARGATEPIYGSRGYRGQGMSPAVASEWIHDKGHLVRIKYSFADLSVYNSNIGTNWGGQGGPPSEVEAEAKKSPARYMALIRNTDEALDALASGYGLHFGTGQGFTSSRDENGISKISGSWGHDMAVLAGDDTRIAVDTSLYLVVNSWGPWNSGGQPKWWPAISSPTKYGPGEHRIPPGSFLITESSMAQMIDEQECWAVGGQDGFSPDPISSFGIDSFL